MERPTIDLPFPRHDGGTEIVRLQMPPLLRRYALVTVIAQSTNTDDPGDLYTMQVAFHAAVGMCWMDDLPGIGRRLPADLIEAGEQVADALDSIGINILDPAYLDSAGEVVRWVVDSINVGEDEEGAAAESARELFPEGAPDGSTSDVPS